MRVLVVEDDPAMAAGIVRGLKSAAAELVARIRSRLRVADTAPKRGALGRRGARSRCAHRGRRGPTRRAGDP